MGAPHGAVQQKMIGHKPLSIDCHRTLCFAGRVTGSFANLDAAFCAALRGDRGAWPVGWADEEGLGKAKRRLIYHGIAGLLNERRDLLLNWPRPLLDTLREESLTRAMWELRHATLLGDAIEGLHAAGVPSVLLKGTALAYGFYTNPALRFRGDTDLLVPSETLPAARTILDKLGWQRTGHGPGPFGPLHYQEVWQFADPAGLTHDIDLHWEVTNSRALRHVLNIDEVMGQAAPLPALSPHARCTDTVTAIIHRAVNRAEHARSGYFSIDRNEFDPNRLLWAVDIDLLAASLGDEEWEALASRCVTRGVAATVGDALDFARASLRTKVPATVRTRLAAATKDTPATRFLQASSQFARTLADVRATPGLLPRLRYILARALPSPAHVRAKYPEMNRWPLGLLYLRRNLAGLARLLKRMAP